MASRVVTDGTTVTLLIGGLEASQVDTADPTRLGLPYMRSIADVIDVMAPSGRALRTLHLGAGLGALARYVRARRPGASTDLVDLARHAPDLDVEIADARKAVERRPKRSYDLVIADVFDGPIVPRHLTTTEFVAAVRRILRPGGVYVVNLIDDPPHRLAKRQVTTVARAFSETLVLGERPVLSGRRTGNFVVAAADRTLPAAKLRRRGQDVLDGEAVALWCERARPLKD